MKKGKGNNRQHRANKCNPNVNHNFKTRRPKAALLKRTKLAREGIMPEAKARSHKKHTGSPEFEGEDLILCRWCHRLGELSHTVGKWPVCTRCAPRRDRLFQTNVE